MGAFWVRNWGCSSIFEFPGVVYLNPIDRHWQSGHPLHHRLIPANSESEIRRYHWFPESPAISLKQHQIIKWTVWFLLKHYVKGHFGRVVVPIQEYFDSQLWDCCSCESWTRWPGVPGTNGNWRFGHFPVQSLHGQDHRNQYRTGSREIRRIQYCSGCPSEAEISLPKVSRWFDDEWNHRRPNHLHRILSFPDKNSIYIIDLLGFLFLYFRMRMRLLWIRRTRGPSWRRAVEPVVDISVERAEPGEPLKPPNKP